MTPYAKTSGSAGIHVYVPIERGPLQKEVWTFAKAFAQTMERLHPAEITAEYTIAKRPAGHVLVDYNQNAWGKTLASVYSVRAKPGATVSTPVTWDEIEAGIEIADFRLDNVRERLRAGRRPVGAAQGRRAAASNSKRWFRRRRRGVGRRERRVPLQPKAADQLAQPGRRRGQRRRLVAHPRDGVLHLARRGRDGVRAARVLLGGGGDRRRSRAPARRSARPSPRSRMEFCSTTALIESIAPPTVRAPAAISRIAPAMSPTRSTVRSTAAMIPSSASLAVPTLALPRAAVAAPASAAATASRVRRCTSTISPPIGFGLLHRGLGQLAHLVGDDREAAPVLARPRRLDRGVERQQVRLVGQRVDRLDHHADLRGEVAQLADLLAPPAPPRARSARMSSMRRADRPGAVLRAGAGLLAGRGQVGRDRGDALDVAGHALRVGRGGAHLHRLVERAAGDARRSRSRTGAR